MLLACILRIKALYFLRNVVRKAELFGNSKGYGLRY